MKYRTVLVKDTAYNGYSAAGDLLSMINSFQWSAARTGLSYRAVAGYNREAALLRRCVRDGEVRSRLRSEYRAEASGPTWRSGASAVSYLALPNEASSDEVDALQTKPMPIWSLLRLRSESQSGLRSTSAAWNRPRAVAVSCTHVPVHPSTCPTSSHLEIIPAICT